MDTSIPSSAIYAVAASKVEGMATFAKSASSILIYFAIGIITVFSCLNRHILGSTTINGYCW